MNQIGIFDGKKKFRNDKPIRLIELFGGISAQATALHELGVEFEHYRYVDFDKYAVKSTNAMYGTNWEATDITKINASDLGIVETDKYCYIMTYSFPCQDLSLAGKGAGMAKGSGTRSGLLWEVERLLNEMTELPQVLIMENVPQVHGKKNIDSFNEWQDFLQRKGYKNYWQDLKATDFGIPQSRERTFMISLLGDYYYTFPKEIKLEYLLKDFLESEVDEKYYLSEKVIEKIKFEKEIKIYEKTGIDLNSQKSELRDICSTIKSRYDCGYENYKPGPTGVVEPKLIQVGNLDIKGNDNIKRVYSSKGLSPTLTTMEGGNRQPKIVEPICLNSKVDGKQPSLRIRKLTPKECWRLMGFRDELFDKAQAINSNSQLYKQAGNSIVTTVLMAIFGELLDINWQEKVEILLKNLTEEENE